MSTHLRSREDFFIKVFKPQYNIKRYKATRDSGFVKHKCKVIWDIPVKVKNLLDKCLDPKDLKHNLVNFVYNTKTRVYDFLAVTPKGCVRAISSGWFEGRIQKPEGYRIVDVRGASKRTIILYYPKIDQNKLQEFYEEKEQGYVKKCLKSKIKALKAELKKEDLSKEEK